MRNLGISVLLIVAILLFPDTSFAAATPFDVKVQVSRELVKFPDAQPFIDERHRLQVPVRFLSEQLGFKVDWQKDGDNIALTLSSEELTVGINTGSLNASVNGNEILLESEPKLSNGRVFVPIRFISELSGLNVKWHETDSLAILHRQGEEVKPLWKAPDWKVLEGVKATAYSDHPSENGGYGALDYMGNKLAIGTVAVDPKVIPLGSTLFIEGYDYEGLPAGGMTAKATDTGGAIKGKKIDIFIPGDRKNALDFGIQKVKVHVLQE